MRSGLAYLGIGVLLQLPNEAGAQKVLIRDATPPAVLEVLKTHLVPQGFTLAEASDKRALFTLDRGNVVQTGPIPFVHVVMELQFRYKAKSEGLEVSASEEAVGATGSRMLDFRKPVNSERATLQRLLDSVRVQLEARPPGDSIIKRDSSPR